MKGRILFAIALTLVKPLAMASSYSYNPETFQKLNTRLQKAFPSFQFPINLNFELIQGADLKVLNKNKIILPVMSACSQTSMLTQVTHEIGHFAFYEKAIDNNSQWAKDYQEFINATHTKFALFEAYDDLEASSRADKYEKLQDLEKQFIALNKVIKKHTDIAIYIMPLEELFADLLAVLYFESALAMRDALICYSEQEAIERDYSIEVPLSYKPQDPYGHSDFLLFGYYFLKTNKETGLSKDQLLKKLIEQVFRYIETHYDNFPDTFAEQNQRLLDS